MAQRPRRAVTVPGFLDEYRGTGPLRDLTILDFTQLVMGPMATQLMGDFGAVVIKVEPPAGEWERRFLPRGRRFEGESGYFLAMNRNKLSLTADLKSERDRDFVLELVERSDVVVNNYRPGVMERLGLGFDALCERNPRLVYGHGTGYGLRGPMAERPGQDLLVQSISGLAANTGGGGGPPIPTAAAICDMSAGLLLAFSIAAAVLDARATGAARQVDVSLLGSALLLQSPEAFLALNTDMEWERSSANVGAPWFGAPYGFYKSADDWISVSMTPRERLIEVFGLSADLLELDAEEWHQRRDNVNGQLAEIIATRSATDWLDTFEAHDMWAAPLVSLDDAVRGPQVIANDFVETISLGVGRGHADVIGLVTKMTGMTAVERLPPPRLGEHNEIIRAALRTSA